MDPRWFVKRREDEEEDDEEEEKQAGGVLEVGLLNVNGSRNSTFA